MSATPTFETLLKQVAHATELGTDGNLRRESREAILEEAETYLGRRIGPFEIIGVIGVGGMGIVFRALEIALQRPVALKILREDLAHLVDIIEEARLAATVEHPNIARVYSVGSDAGLGWIAFELVDGRDLRDVLQRGPLPLLAAVSVTSDVASALSHAHARGLVHCDLKPENILIRPDGRASLLDFGVAARTGGGPRLVAGTPEYAPDPGDDPFAPPTPHHDVHALAVVVCEMLSGHRPLRGQPVALPSSLGASAPRRVLEAFVRDTLGPAPRPWTASALLFRLERSRRPPQLTGRRAAAGAIALLLLGGLIALALVVPRGAAPLATLEPLTGRVDELPIVLAALSPDGERLAWVDGRGLTVLDIETRRRTRHPLGSETSFRHAMLVWEADGNTVRVAAPYHDPKHHAFGGFAATETALTPEGAPQIPTSPRGAVLAYEQDTRLALAGPLDDLQPTAPVEPVILRAVRPSPSADRVAALISPADMVDVAQLVLFDLHARTRTALSELSPHFFMANDQVALAWRGEDELIVGRYEPDRAGGNLWSHDLDGASPPRRLSDWRGLHFGQLSIAANGRDASVVVMNLETGAWVATLDMTDAPADGLSLPIARPALGAVGLDVLAPQRAPDALPDQHPHLSAPTLLSPGDVEQRPSAWSADGQRLLVTHVEDGRLEARALPVVGGPAEAGPPLSSWPVEATSGGPTLHWQLDTGAGHWSLRSRDSLAADAGEGVEGVQPTPGALVAGRPGPPDLFLRCAPLAQPPFCLLATRHGQGEGGGLSLARLAPGVPEVQPLLRLDSAPWNAVSRWDLSPTGDILALAHGATLLRIDLTTTPLKAEALRLGGDPESCWIQYAAVGRGGAPDIVTATCDLRPTFRMFALSGGTAVHLRSADHRWMAHPVLSPDGSRLAWAERAFQTNIMRVRLPE